MPATPPSGPTQPDFSRQGRIDQTRSIYALRLTMQLTPRNKLSVFWDEQPQCSGAAWTGDDGCMSNKEGWIYGGSQNNGFFGAGPNSPETGDYASTHQKVQQVKYTAPATNKLLLEAGFGTYISQWGYSERPGNPTKNLVRVQEQSAQIFDRNGNRVPTSCADCLTVGGNLKYRSSNWPTGYIFAHTWNAAASYVTGAHNMKFGYQGAFHRDDDNLFPTISNDYLTQFTFNTPCSVGGGVSGHSDRDRRHDTVGRVHAKGAHRVLRVLRAGAVDQGSTHPAGRPALRPCVEQLPRTADWSVGDDSDRDRPARADGHQGLQRSQSENRRGLRPVRRRQDVAEGERRTVSAPGIEPGPLHQREPVGAGLDDHWPGVDG